MPISSKKSLNNLCEEVLACKHCLDLVKTRKNPVPGTGASNSKLLIVGYYPTENGAENCGVPFSGDEEGELIRKIISETGLSLNNDTYLTYLVKCTPRSGTGSGKAGPAVQDKKPKSKHVANCIDYLTGEISIITPHVIMSLGLEASNIILENFFSITKKHRNMDKLHMRLFENPSFKLVPFYSPHDITEGSISQDKYIRDFESLSRFFQVI